MHLMNTTILDQILTLLCKPELTDAEGVELERLFTQLRKAEVEDRVGSVDAQALSGHCEIKLKALYPAHLWDVARVRTDPVQLFQNPAGRNETNLMTTGALSWPKRMNVEAICVFSPVPVLFSLRIGEEREEYAPDIVGLNRYAVRLDPPRYIPPVQNFDLSVRPADSNSTQTFTVMGVLRGTLCVENF